MEHLHESPLTGQSKEDVFVCQSQDVSEKSPSHLQPPVSSISPSRDEKARLPDLLEEKPLQRWNESKASMFRYFATLFSFVVIGMNDAAVGALIPYIEPYYNVSYTVISLVFLSSFVGYMFAALLNNIIHHRFGQIGVATMGPLGRLIGYIPMACHPPFAVLPVMMLFPGFGNGLEDSAWNAWIGNMQNANELLGILHGAYGLGGTIAPLIATAMVTKGNLPWYNYYYLMIGMTGLNGILAICAFWGATGRVHRESYKPASGGGRTTTRRVLREPITWILAVFLLGYVGAEVSLGGWVVSFMLDVRGAERFAAGITVTGFWLGLTVGRVILGFVTGRIGEKLAITIYLALCIVLQLLYWLVPSFIASAIFVAFLGFMLGPLFPAAIVAATKLLPVDYHVSAIGFAAAFGGGGAAVFPFAVGAIAQSRGVQVLQPIVLAILAYIFVVWCFLPGGLRPGGLEHARDNNEKIGHEVRSAYRWVSRRISVPKEEPSTASTCVASR